MNRTFFQREGTVNANQNLNATITTNNRCVRETEIVAVEVHRVDRPDGTIVNYDIPGARNRQECAVRPMDRTIGRARSRSPELRPIDGSIIISYNGPQRPKEKKQKIASRNQCTTVDYTHPGSCLPKRGVVISDWGLPLYEKNLLNKKFTNKSVRKWMGRLSASALRQYEQSGKKPMLLRTLTKAAKIVRLFVKHAVPRGNNAGARDLRLSDFHKQLAEKLVNEPDPPNPKESINKLFKLTGVKAKQSLLHVT